MKDKKRRGAPIFALVTISVCLLILVGLFLLNHWRVELRMSAPAEQTLEVGSFYTLPEPTAVLRGDFLLRDGKALEVRRDGEVDTEHLGDYTVRYHAEGLLEEADASLTIHVVDTTPPVLTLVPDAFEYLLPNEVYVEAGFTATDNLDGDLTARVLREVREDGVYYAVSDSSGNRAEAFRPLVRDDPIPPELTLLGEQTMTLRVGGAYEEPGWAAWGDVGGERGAGGGSPAGQPTTTWPATSPSRLKSPARSTSGRPGPTPSATRWRTAGATARRQSVPSRWRRRRSQIPATPAARSSI